MAKIKTSNDVILILKWATRIKKVSSLLLFCISCWFFQTASAFNNQFTDGLSCQPANIGQALQWDLGWSQFGVFNNSPLGSGDFYVVCPLKTTTGFISNLTHFVINHGVNVTALFRHPNAGDVSCFIIYHAAWYNPYSGWNFYSRQYTSLFSILNPGIQQGLRSKVGGSGSSVEVLDNPGGAFTRRAYSATSIICALPPQTGISSITEYQPDPRQPDPRN